MPLVSSLLTDLLSDSSMARHHLVARSNWSKEIVDLLDDDVVNAIAISNEMGLEGYKLPLSVEVPAAIELAEEVTSLDAEWDEYIRDLRAATLRKISRVMHSLDAVGINQPTILNFTSSLSFNVGESDLVKVLSQSIEAQPFTWLTAPGELELDQARSAVGIENFVGLHNLDGRDQVVAVLDGEIDLDYGGLNGRVLQKANFSDTSWGAPGFGDSIAKTHATSVGAILAGAPVAGIARDLRGIAPRATLWNYKIVPASNGSNVAAALEQACIDRVRIANLSWGQSKAVIDGTSIWSRTVDVAFEKGMLTVKSAGNNGPNDRTITAPADARNVISVGSTDRSGAFVHERSSRGPTQDGLPKPDLVAPGGGVIVLNASGDPEPVSSPGTSFAAPIAAGFAALILQQNSSLSPAQLRSQLLSICSPIADVPNAIQGSGLVSGTKWMGAQS